MSMAGGPMTLHAQLQGVFLGRPCRAVAPPRVQSRRLHRQVVSMSAVAAPAELTVKFFDGEPAGTEQLALKGTASTKTRAEVRGGGKKPYAQKGTGNARMGSKRTPLRPGGGVSFGPKPKDWSIKMNKKERRLALATALQSAASSTTVVEDLTDAFSKPSTKAVVQALGRWGVGPREYSLLIVNELGDNLALSARNVERLEVNAADALRVYDVLRADKILIEASALRYIQEFYGDAAEADDQSEASAAVSEAADTPAIATDDAGVIPSPVAEELPAATVQDSAVSEATEVAGVVEAAG